VIAVVEEFVHDGQTSVAVNVLHPIVHTRQVDTTVPAVVVVADVTVGVADVTVGVADVMVGTS